MVINNVKLPNHFFLAPMAGITDAPFRSLCAKMGCGLAYTEMVSARGIYYQDKKTNELLEKGKEEVHYGIQIFGNQPDVLAYAVAAVSAYRPLVIDINMGCPTPKVVKNRDGSHLMTNPVLVGEIVEKAVRATDIPISVKIRSGYDRESINACQIAYVAQESGASIITVHPRTRDMFYTGQADWDLIREVKETVRIPVIGNGDILSWGDAERMLQQTRCDGVMVGRAARGNPWIFRDLIRCAAGLPPKPVGFAEKREVIREHMGLMLEAKGEERGIREMRKHVAWYVKGEKHATRIKDLVFKAKTPEHMEDALDLLDDQ